MIAETSDSIVCNTHKQRFRNQTAGRPRGNDRHQQARGANEKGHRHQQAERVRCVQHNEAIIVPGEQRHADDAENELGELQQTGLRPNVAGVQDEHIAVLRGGGRNADGMLLCHVGVADCVCLLCVG